MVLALIALAVLTPLAGVLMALHPLSNRETFSKKAGKEIYDAARF